MKNKEFNKRLQIETIKKYCDNESLLQLIKDIKHLWGIIFIPEHFIKENKKINYFKFYLNNDFYYIQYNNIYWLSLSSVYKPSKEFWTGSNIINEGVYQDIKKILNNLPKNYFIWNKFYNINKPNFYKNIEEFKNKSYFNLYQF